MSNNLRKNLNKLLETGEVENVRRPLFGTQEPVSKRTRGAGVRGGPLFGPVASLPVRRASSLMAEKAIARMRGAQIKDEQNTDPTGQKLAEAFAKATPVNVSYKGRKAANWVENGITENQVEKNILNYDDQLEIGPEVTAAFEQLKSQKTAIAPISNQSLEWNGRKKLDSMFVNFFRVDKPHSKIGRDLFNAYDIVIKTGNQKPLADYMKNLISSGYSVDYTRGLVSYVKRRYAELKDHYEYYNKKRGASGGKRRTIRRRKLTRRKITRRK
jgi:hypothetical protein